MTHDLKLFEKTHPILTPGEIMLADKAYCSGTSRSMGIVTPKKKPRNGNYTRRTFAFNQLHSLYRVKVEHSIGFIKRFKILSAVYRGSIYCNEIPEITKALKVLIHLNYLHLSMFPIRNAQ